MESITYCRDPENCLDVEDFIGDVPPCPVCDGYGEYDTEYGVRGCQACESRCIPLIDHSGKRVFADWGDTIVRKSNGLHLVQAEE